MDQPKIVKTQTAFSITCSVEVDIRSKPERIWSLLTDAERFPRRNSTVSCIDGEIRDGQQLSIHVPGTDRTFTPKVAVTVPGERMTWTGGFAPMFKGVRTFELRRRGDGSTNFAMREHFSGLMLLFIKGSLPDFGPIFERYANELKHEAERVGL